MDVARLGARTGWHVVHRTRTTSTNDDLAALRDAGARERVAVVADEQVHGRGREGRGFASPIGGLYVSVLLPVPADCIPHHVVAFAALCACEAIESHASVTCGIKWPNDVFIGDRKLGGILLEAAGADQPVVIGIGLNLSAKPTGLPPAVSSGITSLADEGVKVPRREALLASLLGALDAYDVRLTEPQMADAWRHRLLWIGRPVAMQYAGGQRAGVLEDVDLVRGLLVRDPLAGPVWLDAAHVQDLRPA